MKHTRINLGMASLLAAAAAMSASSTPVATIPSRRREPEVVPTEPHKGPVTMDELRHALKKHVVADKAQQARDKAIAAWNLEVVRKKAEKKARRQAKSGLKHLG